MVSSSNPAVRKPERSCHVGQLFNAQKNFDITLIDPQRLVTRGEDLLGLHPELIGLSVQIFDPSHGFGIRDFSKVDLGR